MATADGREIAVRDGARRLRIDGVLYQVYELPGNGVGDGRARLVFECESAVRVVRLYPAHWRGLSDTALITLSWTR